MTYLFLLVVVNVLGIILNVSVYWDNLLAVRETKKKYEEALGHMEKAQTYMDDAKTFLEDAKVMNDRAIAQYRDSKEHAAKLLILTGEISESPCLNT